MERSASRRAAAAHQRPLAAVAVAAAPEHADQPAVGDLPRRSQHVLERVRRVRVVHQHRERLAGVHRLEPAGHAVHRGDAEAHGVVGQLQQLADGDGAEHVLDVEVAAQARRSAAARPRGVRAISPIAPPAPTSSAAGRTSASSPPAW